MAQRESAGAYRASWPDRWVQRLKERMPRSSVESPRIDIRGERDIEWSFLSREMPDGPGHALDFGCEHGYMSLLAAQKGFDVLALDLEQQNLLWAHPRVRFQQGDFLEMSFPDNSFNLIVNCSSVEHVGIVGRYGISAERSSGDLEVMRRFAGVLKASGRLLMTVPCGRDLVMAPWCRVYGSAGLKQLFERFEIMKEVYWTKTSENRWAQSSREAALDFAPVYHARDPHACAYALGCFVLRRKDTADFAAAS
jgi:SAM-dependent methyltransferase